MKPTTLASFLLIFRWDGAFARPSERGTHCKIAILDVSGNEGLGIHCDADARLQTVDGQIVANSATHPGESHIYGQHSAPYWVEQAIRASKFYTSQISQAHAIFVNDYCLMMSHTATLHSGAFSDGFDPKANLQSVYEMLTKSARYQERKGADYVFFSPHPLTGVSGFREFACNAFGSALHIVAEATQRYVCPDIQARSNYLVVPYASSHYVEDTGLWPSRDIFLHFHGTCAQDGEESTYGKRMRAQIVRGVQELNITGALVTCRGDRLDIPHASLRKELKRSIFCLLIPGDTISSRRLTEIMLSGCIPVFLGPPWHAVPLATKMSYTQFSMIFELQSLRELGHDAHILTEPVHDESASSVMDQKWWISPADIKDAAQRVESIKDVVHVLQHVSQSEVERMQKKGEAVRSYFRFRRDTSAEDVHSPKTATDAIIQRICQHANELKAMR